MKSAANPPLQPGDEIPGLTKTAAMPDDAGVRNPIHEDQFAREHGMRGALIGGSTLLSYVLEMLFVHFGDVWYSQGRIGVSFIGGGAIPGDVVTARGRVKAIEQAGSESRVHLDVWMENQNGAKIVVGEASCLAAAGPRRSHSTGS